MGSPGPGKRWAQREDLKVLHGKPDRACAGADEPMKREGRQRGRDAHGHCMDSVTCRHHHLTLVWLVMTLTCCVTSRWCQIAHLLPLLHAAMIALAVWPLQSVFVCSWTFLLSLAVDRVGAVLTTASLRWPGGLCRAAGQARRGSVWGRPARGGVARRARGAHFLSET